MPFDRILGQENAISILRNALLHRRLAHAYLFVGPDGVGKRLTALTLAKAMNCQSPTETRDCCEKCPSCVKVNSSNHADVILLEPEGEVIKIDQVRDIQKQLRFRPLEGGCRAFIIDSAEKLNDAASNALLKTLEEPPDETYLILITSRPHQLLPTILSRCQWIKFKSLSNDQMIQILQGLNSSLEPERAHFYASLAGGSAGKALELSNRVDYQRRLEWLRAFSELSQKTTEEIFEICERIAKEEEEVINLLELWKLWVRDLVVFKVLGKGLINHDLMEEADREIKNYSFEQLESIFGLICDVQKSITLRANRQLALETLMLGMKKTQGEIFNGHLSNEPRMTGAEKR